MYRRDPHRTEPLSLAYTPPPVIASPILSALCTRNPPRAMAVCQAIICNAPEKICFDDSNAVRFASKARCAIIIPTISSETFTLG